KAEIEKAADENGRELEDRDGSLEGATGPPRPWNREIQRALRVFWVHLISTTKNAARMPQINERNRLPWSALRCHRDRLSTVILAPFLAVVRFRWCLTAIEKESD